MGGTLLALVVKMVVLRCGIRITMLRFVVATGLCVTQGCRPVARSNGGPWHAPLYVDAGAGVTRHAYVHGDTAVATGTTCVTGHASAKHAVREQPR